MKNRGVRSGYVLKHPEEVNALVEKIRKDTDWFEPVVKLCRNYYQNLGNPCGGALHIVLDDGNIADTHVAWCAGYANGIEDKAAEEIANLMSLMTEAQRERVYEAYDRYA